MIYSVCEIVYFAVKMPGNRNARALHRDRETADA